jgi:hypothetical protein
MASSSQGTISDTDLTVSSVRKTVHPIAQGYPDDTRVAGKRFTAQIPPLIAGTRAEGVY